MNKILKEFLITALILSTPAIVQAETVKPLKIKAETTVANMDMVIKDNFVKAKFASAENRFAQSNVKASYDDFNDFCERNPGAKIYMATTKAHKTYTEVSYEPDCYIMFGKESAGIPEEILVDHEDTCVRIPMIGDIRSLNLSNSVAIVLYEALRQNNFDHMNQEGHLHRLEWHDE